MSEVLVVFVLLAFVLWKDVLVCVGKFIEYPLNAKACQGAKNSDLIESLSLQGLTVHKPVKGEAKQKNLGMLG